MMPFTGPYGVDKGVAITTMVKTDQSADEKAVAWVAEIVGKSKVLRGWTRKGVPSEPFTSYGIVCRMRDEETGVAYTCESVLIANRVTNTVYRCWLVALPADWQEIEATGETMLTRLRLDPEF